MNFFSRTRNFFIVLMLPEFLVIYISKEVSQNSDERHSCQKNPQNIENLKLNFEDKYKDK